MPKEKSFKIFILEDDDWYREFLAYVASLNPDFEVKQFATGKDFLKNLNECPDVVTLDYSLPDAEGLNMLKQIKEHDPDIEVIIISKQEKIDTAVELLKAGAYDYIIKTNDINERLINLLNNLYKNKKLKNRITTLEREVSHKYGFENVIIGKSEIIQKIFELMDKAVKTNITVLVNGETGTGKELVAKSIHFNSARKKEPFIPVNMSAIPKELAESELFGHEKGSFTGATATRPGKFEQAGKGTIFLDEIGEMDLSLQAKLLRVLQEKEVVRVGGNDTIKIDCRIIAATNKNLIEEVKKGNFREDLFYRLYGLQIELPPLRKRDKDVLIIANRFIDMFCKENNLPPLSLSKEAKQKLLQHSFPGNVRELKSVVELAAVMTKGEEITAENIVLNDNFSVTELTAAEKTLEQYEREIIRHFLKKYDNNISLVAEKLNIGKSSIYRYIKEQPEFFN